MILLNVYSFHSTKLFSSQPFLKPFSKMFAFIEKPLCKRYYIFLCLSLFLLASKYFTAVRVLGVLICILYFWLPGCTLGFIFCMHTLMMTSAFYLMQKRT